MKLNILSTREAVLLVLFIAVSSFILGCGIGMHTGRKLERKAYEKYNGR
jgi:hypothetical protein